MNWHFQTITTPPASFLLLCCLVISLFASCSVGKTKDVYRKNITCIDQERDALLKFKHHIQSDNCDLIASWGNPNTPDCCTWKGVTCSNESGHVIGLYLSGAPYNQDCLDGSVFSPSLGELKHLQYLDLSSNYFNGIEIPNSICFLVNLVYLNLSDSGFYGNIPHQLGNLTRLKSLDLSSNYFNGMVIPTSIGSLVNLVYLNLSNSGFSGNIPLLGNLTRITSLDLSRNDELSAQSLNWLSRLTSLRDINLSGTDLSEAIDWTQSIGSLPMLETLQMDNCQLSTPPPSPSFLQSANLRVISLSGNYFSSSSSFQWLFDNSNDSSLEQSLEHLDLSYNLLQGPIPDVIGNLESLTYLDLSQNLLSSIPDAIANLYSLMHMDLSCNSLSGTILTPLGFSDAVRTMHSLSYLNLSYNRLEGSIPSALLGDSYSILQIDLSNNRLQGPIPSSLGVGSSLIHLDLSNNHLEGAIPSSITNLEYLGYLDLSSNIFSGNIPCKLEIRRPPYFADFANNSLSGSIPKHLSYLGRDAFQGNPNFRTDKTQGRCDKINVGLYVSIGLGFYTGFWAFCGTLTVKNSWRHAYFRFIDHIIDNIYVIVAVNLARFRRNSQM